MSEPIPAAKRNRRSPGETLHGYRIRKWLGDGAFSVVYLVDDGKSHTQYALKHVISEGEKEDRYLDQLRMEWEVGRKLKHPNIRDIVDLRGDQGFGFLKKPGKDLGLVMEMIEDSPVISKISRTAGERLRATSVPPEAAMRRCATRMVRMPALEMNGQEVKSITSSRTPVVSRRDSASGAVVASRWPWRVTVRRSPWVSMVICMDSVHPTGRPVPAVRGLRASPTVRA
jgi:hypothetical protein